VKADRLPGYHLGCGAAKDSTEYINFIRRSCLLSTTGPARLAPRQAKNISSARVNSSGELAMGLLVISAKGVAVLGYPDSR